MSSNEDDDDDGETMNQNKKNEKIKDFYFILYNNLDEIIDKSKSFEEQIKLLKKEKI